MSSHYLSDLFGGVVIGDLVDARNATTGQSMINGAFVVRVPDGVAVDKPTGLADLLTQKYTGLLALNAGFTRIAYDDLLDPTGIDAVNSSFVNLGARGTVSIFAQGPTDYFQSVVVPLAGPAPAMVVVTWETFQYVDSDPKADRVQRTYSELPSSPSNVLCWVSFNSGATYTAALDGAATPIAGPDQGTNLIVRFQNAGAYDRVYLGSWAMLY
jgi:hypothetical protein